MSRQHYIGDWKQRNRKFRAFRPTGELPNLVSRDTATNRQLGASRWLSFRNHPSAPSTIPLGKLCSAYFPDSSLWYSQYIYIYIYLHVQLRRQTSERRSFLMACSNHDEIVAQHHLKWQEQHQFGLSYYHHRSSASCTMYSNSLTNQHWDCTETSSVAAVGRNTQWQCQS